MFENFTFHKIVATAFNTSQLFTLVHTKLSCTYATNYLDTWKIFLKWIFIITYWIWATTRNRRA